MSKYIVGREVEAYQLLFGAHAACGEDVSEPTVSSVLNDDAEKIYHLHEDRNQKIMDMGAIAHIEYC